MTCANCAATIERTLKRMDGVMDASVSYATRERPTCAICPRPSREATCKRRVDEIGYKVIEAAGRRRRDGPEDAELKARMAELNDRKRRLTVGIVLSSIILVLSMGHDFGLMPALPGYGWMLFAPDDPGAVLGRLALPAQRLEGAPESHGQHGYAGVTRLAGRVHLQHRGAWSLGWTATSTSSRRP